MISDRYTIGQFDKKKKNNRQKPILVFGNRPQDIEGYKDAIASDELYVPHHKMEIFFTTKELEDMGRYDLCPANELVWLPISKHNGNRELHIGLRICKCGNKKGSSWKLKSETKERHFYAKYEKLVEKINAIREKRLFKLRFELILQKDTSHTAKVNQIKTIINHTIKNKHDELVNKVESLLKFQKMCKYRSKEWTRLEQKMQQLIEQDTFSLIDNKYFIF